MAIETLSFSNLKSWLFIQPGTHLSDEPKLISDAIIPGWPFYNIDVTRSGNVYTIRGIYDPNAVPEPSTWALLVLGIVVLFLRKRS